MQPWNQVSAFPLSPLFFSLAFFGTPIRRRIDRQVHVNLVALRAQPNRAMWTGYVPECALRGADLSPSYVIEIHSSSICCIVLISESPTGLVLPGSDVKHCTPLLMAVDTETNNKDDAFGRGGSEN